MSEKCVTYQQLRMRRLDGVKDGRATVGIYRIAPLSDFLLQSKEKAARVHA